MNRQAWKSNGKHTAVQAVGDGLYRAARASITMTGTTTGLLQGRWSAPGRGARR